MQIVFIPKVPLYKALLVARNGDHVKYATLLAVGLVVSCGQLDPHHLSKEQAQTLLMASLTTNCAADIISRQVTFQNFGGMPGDDQRYLQLRGWTQSNFASNPALHAVPRPSNSHITSNSQTPLYFYYDLNGGRVTVGYNPVEVLPNGGENAEVETCMYPPSHVDIEDMTPDPSNPKEVTVTYVLTVAPTPISTGIMNAYTAALGPGSVGLPPPALPQPEEQHAVLQRLDSAGWRVEPSTAQSE